LSQSTRVTDRWTNRQTDRQTDNYDSQDRASIATSRDNKVYVAAPVIMSGNKCVHCLNALYDELP